VEDSVAELAAVVLGTERSALAGGGRNNDGIVHKVDSIDDRTRRIEARLSNGGVRVTVHPAVIGLLGTLGAATIGAFVTLIVKVAGG